MAIKGTAFQHIGPGHAVGMVEPTELASIDEPVRGCLSSVYALYGRVGLRGCYTAVR